MHKTMSDIEAILKEIPAEHLDGNLVDGNIASVEEGGRKIVLSYPYPGKSAGQKAALLINEKLKDKGLHGIEVESKTKIASRVVQGGVERIEGVRNVIAVASAKGGVGKSMVAANLALALKAEGASSGLLDADIYGPSVPLMFGNGKPGVDDQEKLVPLDRHGIKVLSMGNLVEEDQAVIWRAPMVVRALQQLLRQSAWGDIDFLVLDMPPGTGDVQLSVAQQVPVTGAVIVTTPHELALADAKRAVSMFNRVSIPVLGHVANMTTFVCPGCGAEHRLFGDATTLAGKLGLKELAGLPLDPGLGAGGAASLALVEKPDGDLAEKFRKLAVAIGVALLGKSQDRSAAFPKIVVSDK